MENARLNVTWAGSNGDLPETVPFDCNDDEALRWAEEAVQQGSIPGIPADPNVSLEDFVVERFPAVGDLPPRLIVRPKTPFGC